MVLSGCPNGPYGAVVTVTVTPGEVTPSCAAVMVAEPTATPVTRPAALTVVFAGVAEIHVAVDVTFCVLPSDRVAMAL